MYRSYTMRGSLYLCPDQPEEWLMEDVMRERAYAAPTTPAATDEHDTILPKITAVHKTVFLVFVGLFMLIPIGGAFAALTIGG
jgi:hypothetical protein